MLSTIQTNLKNQLEKQSLTVAELERRTGLRHAVINILRGRSKNPSIKVAHAIAKELGCSIEDLITDFSSPRNTKPKADLNLVEWNNDLSKAIYNSLSHSILQKKAKLNINEFSDLFKEVYSYCSGSPDQSVDNRFIEWLVAKRC